jgi:hypothetical protein
MNVINGDCFKYFPKGNRPILKSVRLQHSNIAYEEIIVMFSLKTACPINF